MNRWGMRLLQFLFRWWLGRSQRQALFEMRKKGIATYLKVLQGVRLSLAGLITALVLMQLIALGLALMVGAAVFLAPLEVDTKLWVVFGVGASLFLIPVLALSILLSQRVWYRASGAQDMVDDLLKSNPS